MKLKSQDKATIRELPLNELQVQLSECEEKMYKLSFANAVTRLKNGLEIRHLRRHRARLMTWIRQKKGNTASAVEVKK